jgi:signal peptidase I
MYSSSMAPTLKGTSVTNGDWVITEKLSYWFREPRRWEVVTFTNDQGTQVMKRVAGLPGEYVSQSESRQPIEIDGHPVEMPSSVDLKFLRFGNLCRDIPVECGEGYYLLGDDSRDSEDSRFTGPIARSQITGRSWLIVWPLSRFGWVSE